MSDRRPLVAGNWKMYLDRTRARAVARAVSESCRSDRVDVALFPAFTHLVDLADELAGTTIRLGAQDLFREDEGAFTGEISGPMIRDTGATWVLVGHSERRHVLEEGLDLTAGKLRAALRVGLEPVLCVGETLDEREAGRTETVLREQWVSAVEGIPPEDLSTIVIAYEPVWAIGTGQNATPEQADQAHRVLRGFVAESVSASLAARCRILYGGSVKPDNAASLLACENVDGALVGGASLDAESFAAIVAAAH